MSLQLEIILCSHNGDNTVLLHPPWHNHRFSW